MPRNTASIRLSHEALQTLRLFAKTQACSPSAAILKLFDSISESRKVRLKAEAEISNLKFQLQTEEQMHDVNRRALERAEVRAKALAAELDEIRQHPGRSQIFIDHFNSYPAIDYLRIALAKSPNLTLVIASLTIFNIGAVAGLLWSIFK